jgi:hypothetical protein
MKTLLILSLTFVSQALRGQTNNNTISLLKWLIKRDHIQYLNPKSNASVFYDKNALTGRTLITDAGKSVPNTSISDFLSAEERQISKTAPPMLEQIDWRMRYSKLKVKFVPDKLHGIAKETYTIYTFSVPVFLNEEHPTVIIGECFICGPACVRDHMILFELKGGNWQLVARAIITND